MSTGRQSHTATLLASGKVLVVGGCCGIASAELYDPATGTWSPTGSLHTGRFNHTATLLPNGKVLVVGGSNEISLATAELYDPASGTWSLTGAMAVSRQGHTATLLPNGEVLVAGGTSVTGLGFNQTFVDLASAELYDPATGTWSQTGSLAQPRTGHVGVLLLDGTVLVAGGDNQAPELLTTELYTPPTTQVLPPTCALSGSGTDASGHAFIKVAARDIASGLQSVRVLKATNASVSLPSFPAHVPRSSGGHGHQDRPPLAVGPDPASHDDNWSDAHV
jgi:hypothetical protein